MRRKHVLSLFALSMGVALLVAATTVGVAASATKKVSVSAKSGGTLHINQSAGTFDTLDPQLAYVTNDWNVLDSTQLMLLNYQDKAGAAGNQLIPEAAKAFPTISNHGKTYTYHLRKGLKFSDGSPVTAVNFQRAFERILSPHMFAQYGVYDGIDQDLVGGTKFAATCSGCTVANAPKHIAGIKAKGLKLTIHLTKPVPYFESLLAMQWFGAIKKNMPYTNSKSGILKYASAGPYYIASNNLNTYTILKRNKHFSKALLKHWPARSAVIQIHNLTDPDTSMLQIEKNQVDFDMGGVPANYAGQFHQKYGVNKSRYKVGVTTCTDWIALNNARGATAVNNVRKALNYALGRNQLINVLGVDAGKPADQALVPGLAGYKKLNLYPNNPNPAKAKSVGGSALANSTLDLYYNGLSATRTHQAELMQSELQAVGAKVTMDPETSGDYYGPLETKGTKYNVARAGWCADYFDPYDYINVNFDGRSIQDTGNVDYFYFNNAAFNAKMDAAAAKTGKARATAYAALDKLLNSKYTPMVGLEADNARYFTSNKVHNYIYSIYFNGPDFNAMSVK